MMDDFLRYYRLVRQAIIFFPAMTLILRAGPVVAQESGTQELMLEQLTQASEDPLPEEDENLPDIEALRKHRLNLNQASQADLLRLPGVSPWQAWQLLQYRKAFGELLDLAELQAVPGWYPEVIRALLPLVDIHSERRPLPLMKERMEKGEQMLLFRFSAMRTRDISGPFAEGRQDWAGMPAGMLLRYRFQFRDLLQWGITVEKDAGERWFPGKLLKGPDFLSLHLAIRSIGPMRALLLGDFQVNLGQGLVQWQGMAALMGSGAGSVFRKGQGIRAHRGTDEARFFRGLATEWGWRKMGLILFGSVVRRDATLAAGDSTGDIAVSSIRWSGWHRTASERAGWGQLQIRSLGSSWYWDNGRWRFSWNMVGHWFDKKLQPTPAVYQLAPLSGERWLNQGLHYQGNWGRVFLFGEAAMSQRGAMAFQQGLLMTPSRDVELAFLVRHFSPRYRTLQASAFSQQSAPSNESGIYLGMTFRPQPAWQVEGWVDMARFPWLRYRVDAPSFRVDHSISLSWKPQKKLILTQRASWSKRWLNQVIDAQPLPMPALQSLFHYRFQFEYHPDRTIRLIQRVDMTKHWMTSAEARGAMISVDLNWQPPKHPISYSARVSWFDTDNYETRIYQMERDVLYLNSMSAFYRRGTRIYLLAEVLWARYWTAWVKWSWLLYVENQDNRSRLEAETPLEKHVFHIQFRRIMGVRKVNAAKKQR